MSYVLVAGFNPNSGYVYLALGNGTTIASAFGQDVEYIIYDFETDEEMTFDSFEELENYWINQN